VRENIWEFKGGKRIYKETTIKEGKKRGKGGECTEKTQLHEKIKRLVVNHLSDRGGGADLRSIGRRKCLLKTRCGSKRGLEWLGKKRNL